MARLSTAIYRWHYGSIARRGFAASLLSIGMSVVLITVFPVPASAAIPAGMPSPGAYPLSDYTAGTVRSSSTLVVSDSGQYKQAFNTGGGLLEIWPEMSTNVVTPSYIKLSELNLGGIYFYPDTNSFPVRETTYRPYQAPGVFVKPGARSTWSMYSSQAGGVHIDGEWVVVGPVLIRVNDQLVQVQQLDITLTFWGGGSGTITHRHFEVAGSALDFRDDFDGRVTILGTTVYLNTSVAHGLLAG